MFVFLTGMVPLGRVWGKSDCGSKMGCREPESYPGCCAWSALGQATGPLAVRFQMALTFLGIVGATGTQRASVKSLTYCILC